MARYKEYSQESLKYIFDAQLNMTFTVLYITSEQFEWYNQHLEWMSYLQVQLLSNKKTTLSSSNPDDKHTKLFQLLTRKL